MEDIIFRIVIGVKNDELTEKAGAKFLADILQDRIEKAVLNIIWVNDLLTERENDVSTNTNR